MTTTNDDVKKGFSGISDLVTKPLAIEAPVPPVEFKKPPIEITPQAAQTYQQTTQNHQPQGEKNATPVKPGMPSAKTWLIIGAAILAFIFWVKNNKNEPTGYKTNSPTLSAANSSVDQTLSANNSSENSTGSAYSKPDAGTNLILSTSQIRWCLKETVRIESIRNIINSDEMTLKFNTLVNDFNMRCSSYRYNRNDFQIAQTDVNNERQSIAQEAISSAQAWIVPDNNARDKQTEGVVHEAQRLLTHLGYKPGAIDGQYASKTIRAVKQFQKAHGLKADGLIDTPLLNLLRLEVNKQQNKTDS